jgi:hypothetical protein
MPRKINNSTLSGKNLRIQFIHEFVLNKKGHREALLEFVNEKLKARHLNKIGLKMLDVDLKDLNEGNFPGADTTLPRDLNGKIYYAEFNRIAGTYEYRTGTKTPSISYITEDERMTLPFVKGLLDQYGPIPAIEKLFNESQALFNVDLKEEQKLSKSFVVKNPVYSDTRESGLMIQRVIKLLNHIKKKEVLQIKYSESKKLEIGAKRELQSSSYLIYPLSIRLHDNLYYLTTISQKKSKAQKSKKETIWMIRNFRIDLILDNIKNVPNPEMPHLYDTFDDAKEWLKHDVEENMSKSIGIWNFPKDAVQEVVHIRFFGWAANHLKVFDIHPTQIIYHTDVENDFIDVEFKFYTYPQHRALSAKKREENQKRLNDLGSSEIHFPHIPIFDRYPETASILGQFINFMVVLPKKSI